MSFIASMKTSWYLGEGSKLLKKGRYERALVAFLRSLQEARKTNDPYEIAVPLEYVAETYLRLSKYDEAKLYADESLELYERITETNKSEFIKQSINRVSNILDRIRQGADEE